MTIGQVAPTSSLDENVRLLASYERRLGDLERAAGERRGEIARTTSTSTTSLITGDIDVMTVTFTAVAGHRYKISLLLFIQAAGSASTAFGKITDNTPTQIQVDVKTVPASGFTSLFCFEEVSPPAGPVTYRGRISATASVALTGSAIQKHYLLVEDLGPV